MRAVTIGLTLGIILASGCKPRPSDGTLLPAAALALVVVGNVQVDGSPIRTGARIQGDKWITTGPGSFCDLQIRGSSAGIVVRLTENSRFRLNAVFKTASAEHSGDLTSGGLLVSVSKMGKSEAFRIKTPTAIAAVRGTKFDIYIFNDGNVKTSVLEGTVAVRLSTGQIENLDPRLLEHSETLRAIVKELESKEVNVDAGKETVVAHYVLDAEAAATIEEAIKLSKETTMTPEQIQRAGEQIDENLKAKLDSIQLALAKSTADVKVQVKQRPPGATDEQFEEMLPIDVPLNTDETIDLQLDKRNQDPSLRQKLFVRIEHVTGGKLDRLVLRDGTIVDGVVRQVIMDYVVTTPEGERTIPGDDLKEMRF